MTTVSSTLDWRAWWCAESERTGTGWRNLLELHVAIVDRLRTTWCSS